MKRRATPPSVFATLDQARVRWQPGESYGDRGTFTAPGSVMARIEEAVENRTTVPIKGILVEASDTNAPGAMAAMTAAALKGIRFTEIPDEVSYWFSQNRPEVTRVTEEELPDLPEMDLGQKIRGVLKRRLI